MTGSRLIGSTVAVTVLVLALLGAIFAFSGVYDVGARGGERGVLGSALHVIADRSIATHAREVPPPPPLDSAALIEGAEQFQATCVACHGAPGVPRSEIGEGLDPQAPDLSRAAAGRTEAEVYWIIRNGIRFTGMPSFRTSQTDEQMWAIARFVKRTGGVSADEYEAIFLEIMEAGGMDSAASTSHGH